MAKIVSPELIAAKSGIYKITNLVNQKLYIGSSANLVRRQKDHFKKLSINRHPNSHLQSAVNHYGIENFIFQVIEYCEKDQLLTKEQYHIDQHDSCNMGYNMCPVAASTLGRKHSEEAKRKMSASRIGKPGHRYIMPKETKEKLSRAHMGKKLSSEHRKKIANSLSTRIITENTRHKLSISKIGNQYTKGRILPLSQKLNISKGNRGKVVSAETKFKISKALKGRPQPWNSHPRTEEEKRKMSIGVLNYYSRQKEAA